MVSARHFVFAAALGLLSFTSANTAMAGECTTLSFSVNDYGKDGPSKDAQALLDKHIAKWAEEKKVKKYKVGKKDVQCDLFLDFVVFDEYTCKASAKVCW
jgi:hypothetical protein